MKKIEGLGKVGKGKRARTSQKVRVHPLENYAKIRDERTLWKEKSYLSNDLCKNHRETNFTLKCEWWAWKACPTIEWRSYQKLVRLWQKDSGAHLIMEHWAPSNSKKRQKLTLHAFWWRNTPGPRVLPKGFNLSSINGLKSRYQLPFTRTDVDHEKDISQILIAENFTVKYPEVFLLPTM